MHNDLSAKDLKTADSAEAETPPEHERTHFREQDEQFHKK